MSQEYSDEELLDQLQQCKDEHGKCTPRLFNRMERTASASLVMRRFGSWVGAKEEAGIDEDLSYLTGRDKQYTDEQVLDHIRECARRNDGRCTVAQLNEADDLVSPSVAVERFGSWKQAKQKAGLDDDRTSNARPREYSDEDYLELINECYEEHGKVTQRLFNQRAKDRDDHPTAGAVRKRFGKWGDAVEQAGIDQISRSYERDDLIQQLQMCEDRYGNCSASRFAADDDFASPETIQRRFGSWQEGKDEAGVE